MSQERVALSMNELERVKILERFSLYCVTCFTANYPKAMTKIFAPNIAGNRKGFGISDKIVLDIALHHDKLSKGTNHAVQRACEKFQTHPRLFERVFRLRLQEPRGIRREKRPWLRQ